MRSNKKPATNPVGRAPAQNVREIPNIPKVLDMSSTVVTLTYGEISAAYAAMGFIGSRLDPHSFPFNTKLRMMRRALKDSAEDLDDMTQKLMLSMAMQRDEEGEIVRDEKTGNFSVKQPDFDIERRTYMRTTVDIVTPVWRPCELEWMQDAKPEGVNDGFVFEVLENLGPLYTEDDECGPQDD